MIPKFRGKSTAEENKGEWVCGNLIADKTSAYITDGDIDAYEDFISIERWCSIDVNTIGRSTGLFDKNSVEVFEGDLLSWNGGMPHVVKFGRWIREDDLGYKIKNIGFYFDSSYDNTEWLQGIDYEIPSIKFEIIGNVYENPEFVEGDA